MVRLVRLASCPRPRQPFYQGIERAGILACCGAVSGCVHVHVHKKRFPGLSIPTPICFHLIGEIHHTLYAGRSSQPRIIYSFDTRNVAALRPSVSIYIYPSSRRWFNSFPGFCKHQHITQHRFYSRRTKSHGLRSMLHLLRTPLVL